MTPTFPYRPPAPPLPELASTYLYVHDNPGCSALEVAKALHPDGTPTPRAFQAVKYLMHCTPPVIFSLYSPDDSRFRLYLHTTTDHQEPTP